MRFKVDENLPLEVAAQFRDAGHEAHTVLEQSMGGGRDPLLAEHCRREDQAIITLDQDFADIRAHPPEQYSAIIVLRVARQDKPHVVGVVERLLPLLTEEPLNKHLWIVDEQSVRIRGSGEGRRAKS